MHTVTILVALVLLVACLAAGDEARAKRRIKLAGALQKEKLETRSEDQDESQDLLLKITGQLDYISMQLNAAGLPINGGHGPAFGSSMHASGYHDPNYNPVYGHYDPSSDPGYHNHNSYSGNGYDPYFDPGYHNPNSYSGNGYDPYFDPGYHNPNSYSGNGYYPSSDPGYHDPYYSSGNGYYPSSDHGYHDPYYSSGNGYYPSSDPGYHDPYYSSGNGYYPSSDHGYNDDNMFTRNQKKEMQRAQISNLLSKLKGRLKKRKTK